MVWLILIILIILETIAGVLMIQELLWDAHRKLRNLLILKRFCQYLLISRNTFNYINLEIYPRSELKNFAHILKKNCAVKQIMKIQNNVNRNVWYFFCAMQTTLLNSQSQNDKCIHRIFFSYFSVIEYKNAKYKVNNN